MNTHREITYREALDEGLCQAMRADASVIVLGCGVNDTNGIFGTTLAATNTFPSRVIDTPLSENAIAGVAVGMALRGMRPVIVHARNDFLLLTMDQLINHAAKWRYMTAGRLGVPLTVRAIIGRGWGQAAQHSQSLQALFAHIPGLKVVMPSNAYDAKGLLTASIADANPVISIEHRWLFEHKSQTPEEFYTVPLGKARIARHGNDITVVAVSYMVHEALQAAQALSQEGIEAEIVDLRSIRPWDEDLVLESVRKTGRLIVADTAWQSFGISAEISARVAEKEFASLKSPIRRICLPDAPTPCSPALEKIYYPGAAELQNAAREMLQSDLALRVSGSAPSRKSENHPRFEGPF